ncbi:SAM-motif ubiquitously expressed punctatedly localized protein isoform X2 [Rhynchophorus ferrugineus]|uniref:SAM-motif ubiquitously expressed punctatedly localized protein isoform X2 n=1 Tax=Rhynchophorus ferrugineus TaxID=354439 RepID=UPI003FCC43A7
MTHTRCGKQVLCNLTIGMIKVEPIDIFENGETSSSTETLESPLTPSKSLRKKRMDRTSSNNNGMIATSITTGDYALHNNNNNVKNERLSPSTPDTSSRSRSVTPSSATHSETPPALENPLLGPVSGRNYSDFMRSLAAKYNHTNPNDYFNAARNGFPPPLDPRFKAAVPPITFPTNLLPALTQTPTKEGDLAGKKPDFASVLSPFAGAAAMLPPYIDMSTTQTLLAMVRTAKEAELQGLLKNVKRQDSSSPLDLSSAALPTKRPRIKTPSMGSPCNINQVNSPNLPKRPESESPKLHEDISSWSVDDVANFVGGIDICAEYAQNFRDQRIDGSGLPLLTEEHLTNTIGMKLGPALKLRSILAKKLGSCSVCLHCTHCHNSGNSPEASTGNGGNTSDSGGTS